MSDDEKTTCEREGWTRIFAKGTFDYLDLAYDEHDKVKSAWMSGKTFVETCDPYKSPVTLRLADVAAVTHASPETIARYNADEELQRKRDKKKNLFDGD